MNYFRRRQLRKKAKEILRHARHVRNMREDLMSDADLARLASGEDAVREVLRGGDASGIEQAGDALYSDLQRFFPARPHHGLRENIEILVVALTVAMGVRTYFVQPFKIPTGSMEPTLYGVHTIESQTGPGLTDRMPLKLVRWVLTGEWYREVRVKVPGEVSGPRAPMTDDPVTVLYDIGPHTYKLPKAAVPRYERGDYVGAGEVFWAGRVVTGDHVFVDKVRWNFVRPKRGRIVVFSTDRIEGLPGGTHYIKRLIGLPGETVSIDPPNVKIGGDVALKPDPIARNARRGYGYQLTRPGEQAILSSREKSIALTDAQYFVLGDNTGNSRDGRYWGSVPESAMVGPAFMVYWPLSRRWGPAR